MFWVKTSIPKGLKLIKYKSTHFEFVPGCTVWKSHNCISFWPDIYAMHEKRKHILTTNNLFLYAAAFLSHFFLCSVNILQFKTKKTYQESSVYNAAFPHKAHCSLMIILKGAVHPQIQNAHVSAYLLSYFIYLVWVSKSLEISNRETSLI